MKLKINEIRAICLNGISFIAITVPLFQSKFYFNFCALTSHLHSHLTHFSGYCYIFLNKKDIAVFYSIFHAYFPIVKVGSKSKTEYEQNHIPLY